MAKRSDKRLTKRAATVRVIRWEPLGWGVDIDRGNGKHTAYPVGPQEAAEAEAKRIRSGGRARSRSAVLRFAREHVSA
jgi:hypothetical protein